MVYFVILRDKCHDSDFGLSSLKIITTDLSELNNRALAKVRPSAL